MTTTEQTQPGGIPDEHRIVVGTDGSKPSLAAVEWAAHQAELTGAVLEVVLSWEWPLNYGWMASAPTDYDPAADALKVVEEVVAETDKAHPDLTIRSLVVEGHPAPALVTASKGADLLVVGNRGHGEFAGMLVGSVSEHCVASAHCPVLVFRESH